MVGGKTSDLKELVLTVPKIVLPAYLRQDAGGFLMFGTGSDAKFFPYEADGTPVHFDVRAFLESLKDGRFEQKGLLDAKGKSYEEGSLHVTTHDIVYHVANGVPLVLSGVYDPPSDDEKQKSKDIAGLRVIGWGGHVSDPRNYGLQNGNAIQAMELTNTLELHEEIVNPLTIERRRFGVIYTPVDRTNNTHVALVDLVQIHDANVTLSPHERKHVRNPSWLPIDSIGELFRAEVSRPRGEEPLTPWARALVPALQETRKRPFAGYGR